MITKRIIKSLFQAKACKFELPLIITSNDKLINGIINSIINDALLYDNIIKQNHGNAASFLSENTNSIINNISICLGKTLNHRINIKQ